MGYIFLALALASGITKGYCGKRTSSFIVTNSDSMIMNLLRMIICIFIVFLLILVQNELPTLAPDSKLLMVAALSGIASAAFVVSWLLSVRTGAYMMVEVFLLIGVMVPIVLCKLFFNEKIGYWQILGFVILTVAVYIMTAYNSSVKGKMSVGAFVLLMICGISNGLADFSQKLFVKTSPDGSVAAFNFYTYVFASLSLVAAYVVFRAIDKKNGAEIRDPIKVIKPIRYYVPIMAVCLFAHSFFKTLAAGYIDSVQLYPLAQGCSVVLALLMSAIFFKEKITFKCVVGICLSFVALLMINLL
jgi:drug/metabolite transporter (DMT)-like permease